MKKTSLKSVLGASLVLAALSVSVNATEAQKSASANAGNAETKKEPKANASIKIKDNTHQIKTMGAGTKTERVGL